MSFEAFTEFYHAKQQNFGQANLRCLETFETVPASQLTTPFFFNHASIARSIRTVASGFVSSSSAAHAA